MVIAAKILSGFWNERFWLPPNKTWQDIEPGSHGIDHADPRHLIYPIPIAFVLITLRFLLERFLLKPLGKYLGIESKHRKLTPNVNLEKSYRKNSKIDQQIVQNLCKQLDISEREIERWWRLRKAQDKPTKLKKFSESSWRFLVYLFSFSFGLVVLWDKSWLWNLSDCSYLYPHHSVTDGIWWYYMITFGFYLSQFITQFTDTKRSDFWQMFIHHVVVLILHYFSWTLNMFRIGSLILVVHDCADFVLDLAKALKYAKLQKACDVAFISFVIVWTITRLLIFPRILIMLVSETLSPAFCERAYPVLYLLNVLLFIILFLNVFWSCLIFKIVANTLKKGFWEKDERSSEDESEED